MSHRNPHVHVEHQSDQSIPNCYQLFLIIHHPRTSHVLATQSPPGRLPCHVTTPPPIPFYFENTHEWLPRIRHYFGFNFHLTLLRCMWYKKYDRGHYQKDHFRAIVVMESHGDCANPPPGTQWMYPESIVFPQSVIDDNRHTIDQFLHECRTDTEPNRRPFFARRRWYDKAIEWVSEQLASNGYRNIHAITQIKASWRGAVFKVEMVDGVSVFLKCNPFFTNEAAVCQQLAELIPKYVVAPIAVDSRRCLLLLKDHGTILSPFGFDNDEKVVWANELAELQQATIGAEQVLLRAGLRRLTLDVMASEVDNMLDYAKEMEIVNYQVIEELEGYSEKMKQNCREVQELGIPPTFVHGDLYFTNAYRSYVDGASHGMIDFGESTISHPFIDAFSCHDYVPYYRNWIAFLESTMPLAVRELDNREMPKLHSLSISLLHIWEPVRLYLETKEVECPMPPELLEELRGHLIALLRVYKPKRVVDLC